MQNYKIKILKSSQNLINEMYAYQYITDKYGYVTDRPEGGLDHLIDAARYACMMKLSVKAQAKGKYLIFLNADTTVTKNWIKPMYDIFSQYQNVGIVGNLILQSDMKIDSCGSDWSDKIGDFMHVGKDVHKGKMLHRPYTLPTFSKLLELATDDRKKAKIICWQASSPRFSSSLGVSAAFTRFACFFGRPNRCYNQVLSTNAL
jgi:hypothetical protein